MNTDYFVSWLLTTEGTIVAGSTIIYMILLFGALAFHKHRLAGLVGLPLFLFADWAFARVLMYPRFVFPAGSLLWRETYVVVVLFFIMTAGVTIAFTHMVVRPRKWEW